MKKTLKRIFVGALIFALSTVGAYFLTPNKSIKISYDFPTTDERNEDSHFQKFIERFSLDTGITEPEEVTKERHYYGMQASFDDFSLEFKKDGDSILNTINFDGQIDFMMKGLHDINFNIDLDVDYNDRYLPLELGYVNQTFYFGLKDLRMKMGNTTFDELKGDKEHGVQGLIYQLFIASEEEGGLDFDFERFFDEKYNALIDSLIGNIDLSDLTSSLSFNALPDDEAGIGLDVEEKETLDGYDFLMHIDFNKKDVETQEITCTDLDLTISVDKEYQLRRVDFGTLSFANLTIKGALDIDYIQDLVVIAPNDPLYPRYNANYDYIEVINYRGWLQKIANFLGENNQKLGVSFALNLKQKEDDCLINIGDINGSIGADFSKLIDLSSYKLSNPTTGEEDETSLKERLLNKATFGLSINMVGQEGEECGNLSVKYVDNAGYLKLNEFKDESESLNSVLKCRIDTETMNWLTSEMPEMIKGVGDIDTSFLDDLFSFISDSSFVRSIKEGEFAPILDLITELKNDVNTITLGLDLASLGLGDNAEVNMVLDARNSEDNRVLSLDVNNVEMGSLVLNATINSDDYDEIILDEVDSYDDLTFIPTVTEQVCDILGDKQVAFSIDGALLDDKNLGIVLDGQAQFDYGIKYGFGDFTIDQFKYEGKGLYYSHQIALEVDDKDENNANNNVYFIYGDVNSSQNIKGKMNMESILDIVDLIKTFIDENKQDEKWHKFLEPLLRKLSLSELADIINEKNYFRLLKNDLVKSVSYRDDVLNVTIGGFLFGLEGDIRINATFDEGKLASLHLVDLGLSNNRKLNLNINLEQYQNNATSRIDKTASFMDLSSISVLLKFGINTTKNNYYHLSGEVDLSALAIINLGFNLEVYVVVKDAYVKIYGLIPDTKLSSVAQDYTPLYTTSIKSEFTFESYSEDDPNREDGVGGYFHIKTTKETWFSTDIRHYKSTSKNFIESDNIMVYLLNDLLLVRESITDLIGNLSLEKGTEAGEFTNLFTDTGFKYNENQKRWDVGINLNEITGIDALRELELSIYGDNNEMLSKINANMNIKASLVTIKINATFNLETPDVNVNDWSASIENSFTSINNVTFPESKLNNPKDYIQL